MIDHRIGKIKVRRGTDSQRKLVTFEEGELVYSIDKQRLYIGNSEEKGGILVSNRNYVKNSVGDPAVAPQEVLHGDIVYDKSNSRTYITKCDTLSCELILIADANCCAQLQNEINDLYDRVRTLMPCATTTPPPTPPPTKLTWYTEPSHISVNLGETATFTASAIGGVGVITYKWNRKDGTLISVLDNQPTLTLTTQLSDESTYYCVANTFSESITSKDAVLSIGANSILAEDGTYILSELQEFIDWEVSGLLAPIIITHPRSQVTTALVPVTFEITATGSEPLMYQWRINGVNQVGETNRTYTITNPTKDLTGINCVVSNLVGSVTSNYVDLTVGIKPTIVTQPVSKSSKIGSSVTFDILADGTSPLSYQWRKDGIVINGATSNFYTINSVQNIDFGDYYCIVSNAHGSVGSVNANLKLYTISGCNINMTEYLYNNGWDGNESSLSAFTINLSGNIGCCGGTTPTFNWGTLNVNNFITNIVYNDPSGRFVLAPSEVLPAKLTLQNGKYYIQGNIKGGFDVTGGTAYIGGC